MAFSMGPARSALVLLVAHRLDLDHDSVPRSRTAVTSFPQRSTCLGPVCDISLEDLGFKRCERGM